MTIFLNNHLGGQWQQAGQAVHTLSDPVTGDALAATGGAAAGLQQGFAFARTEGAKTLQAMSYGQRAAMLSEVVKLLQSKRDDYYAISLANSGTTKADSGVDVDGGIFTLGFYAKLGAALGDAKTLTDGAAAVMSKDQLFQSQHLMVPIRGLALFINAFNFPSWGLWEKAAPALLSGVPVVVKPATVTAWLTHQMVKDVVDAGIRPVRREPRPRHHDQERPALHRAASRTGAESADACGGRSSSRKAGRDPRWQPAQRRSHDGFAGEPRTI